MKLSYLVVSLSVLAACAGDENGNDSADSATGDASASSSSSSGVGGGSSGAPGASSGSGTSGGIGDGGGSSGALPAPACNKRGVAYGHHSPADLQALRPGISWWYNWAYQPDELVRGVYTQLGVEYVPMIWGGAVDTVQAEGQMPAARALLGFNEPNFGEQANMSAADAAAKWPSVQAIADAKNLTLVSPAVNFCGGNCQDTDPFSYLEDFFASCTNCRVDAIAVHVYVGCAGEGGNHAKWLVDKVAAYEERFTQPIWLTEFACDDAKNEAEQQAFLVDAVTYLESDPRVQRYAWFAGRADNVAHVDLLGADGQLTGLGETYVGLPHAECTP